MRSLYCILKSIIYVYISTVDIQSTLDHFKVDNELIITIKTIVYRYLSYNSLTQFVCLVNRGLKLVKICNKLF